MNTYLIFKHLHMSMATLTLVGFIIRGIWMMRESPLLEHKLTKVMPHVIDTLLLVSAIVLVLQTGFYPLTFDWVTIKIVLLIAYIVLGTFALKRGKTKPARVGFFLAALACILTIFAVASIKPMF